MILFQRKIKIMSRRHTRAILSVIALVDQFFNSHFVHCVCPSMSLATPTQDGGHIFSN